MAKDPNKLTGQDRAAQAREEAQAHGADAFGPGGNPDKSDDDVDDDVDVLEPGDPTV